MAEATAPREGEPVMRRHLPFEFDNGVGERGSIGVVVASSELVLEQEFRQLLDLPGVAVYASRIHNDPQLTPETLAAMADRIAGGAALLLPGMDLDVVAFGATAASTVIGDERVFEKIHKVRPQVECTTPLRAAAAAFEAMGARRVALLSPYGDEINQRLRERVQRLGYAVRAVGSFNEDDDSRAARITERSVRDAAVRLGRRPEVDMVFVASTSLRLAAVANEIEAELGKPVSSSNHALAWHCLRLVGVGDTQPGFGKLYTAALR